MVLYKIYEFYNKENVRIIKVELEILLLDTRVKKNKQTLVVISKVKSSFIMKASSKNYYSFLPSMWRSLSLYVVAYQVFLVKVLTAWDIKSYSSLIIVKLACRGYIDTLINSLVCYELLILWPHNNNYHF